MKKFIVSTILISSLIALVSPVFAIENLVHQQILYQGSKTINSSQERNPAWSRISSTYFTTINSPLLLNAPQKWRLRVFYSVPEATGSFSIQARVNLGDNNRPIFSLGWDNAGQKIGSREATSNWLELPESSSLANLDLDIYLARAANNPNVTIEIHSVQLEIWQDTAYSLETKNAAGPLVQPVYTPNPLANPQEMAKNQGLEFLKAAMMGDRNTMDQLLSLTPVNMTQMVAIAPNNVALLALPAGKTFQDYLDNYDVEVFSYKEITGLFDDWEKYVINGWQISDKSYIFIGNNVKLGREDFMSNKPLILVMEEENGKMLVKGVLS